MLKRIYGILQPYERKEGCRMAISVFISALLDFIGLASLLPILYFLLDNGKERETAFIFCLLSGVVIILKNIVITLLLRYQNKYLFSFYRRLSFSLYSSYYKKGLLFIREQGCNKLGYEINSVCYLFSNNLMAPFFYIAGEVLLIIFVTIALLIFDGATVLLLYSSFVPFMCIYIFIIRKYIRKYGKEDVRMKHEQSRIVLDTFRGFTELEVNGAFPAFRSSFLRGIDCMNLNRLKINTILKLPLFLSELSVIAGLSVLMFSGSGNIRIMIGVFALAAFRLLPALRTILVGWTQIQNTAYCLDIIERGLADYRSEWEGDDLNNDISFNRMIAIDKLCYTYPNGSTVLKDFDCCISKGEWIGFQGYTGAGKSTLFNILTGLLRPDSGKIMIDDVPLSENVRKSWLKKTGYVLQEVYIFNGTLAENIALGCECIDRDRVIELLESVCLNKWLEMLPDGIDTLMSEDGQQLSGGQKQRIGIARALYREQVEVLFLDEATSALDSATEKNVNEIICKLRQRYNGLTVLSISHKRSSLAYCDRIIFVNDNKI